MAINEKAGKATIQHLELTDEDGETIVEKVKLVHLRPEPPEPPEGFLECLKPGALAEFEYLKGWWEVSVLKRNEKTGKFQVNADKYDAKHTVQPEKLRPAWAWEPGAGHWMQREPSDD